MVSKKSPKKLKKTSTEHSPKTVKKAVSKEKTVEKQPEPAKKGPEKVVITNEIRRAWLRLRKAWGWSFEAFSNTLGLLNTKEANMLYDIVKHSLFKGSYVEIIREHPELREIVKTDEDRLCMHDIYEILSWKLGRKEELPPDRKISRAMKGRIGREVPIID